MRNLSAMVPGNKRNRAMPDAPDVTLIFAEDVLEWDVYLSRQLEGVSLHRQQLERLAFPLANSSHALRLFGHARVVLLVLSPAMIRFLDLRAGDCFSLCRLLPPSRTIAMLCGVEPSAVDPVKNVLISYDAWRHLEAKDKDVQMARAVIEMIHESLAQAKQNERLTKPKFKLVPRKVIEGNGKVYVMLAKAIDINANIRVTLEADGAKEVTVKKRNPYTLVFVIPDDLIHVQTLVTVCVWEEEELLGVSTIKCVSKLGELHSLLSTATSPYAFLCSTLGLGALSEADQRMAEVFRRNKPTYGFHLLEGDATRKGSHTSEELPSLLHFSARYGLVQLATELLTCPGARAAASWKNARGLTPAQMANYEGHNQVAALIDNFVIDNANDSKLNNEKPISLDLSTRVEKTIVTECQNPMDNYDIPAQPTPVAQDRDYLKMKGVQKENVEPNFFLEEHLDSMRNSPPSEKSTLSLLESQAKLIKIMEAYKNGASLTEVEKLHNEWKVFYQVSDSEAKGKLDELRNLYAKAQKAKMSKKHSTSFSELRHFLNSKLKRKDSSTSIDSKGSSKNPENTTSEQPQTLRPISILSNASTSSGSSFDRLSMASAGSDSGHHSDFGDDRHESKDLRCMKPPKSYVNFPRTTLNLKSKPPAPPPRPLRCEDSYSLPSSRTSSLSSDYRRKTSLPLSDFCNTMENYDLVPPPRPSSSLGKPIDTRLDYDMVPPPLPLSVPPHHNPADDYDEPKSNLPCVSDLLRLSDVTIKGGVITNWALARPDLLRINEGRSLMCVPPTPTQRCPTEDYDIPKSSNAVCISQSNKLATPPSPMDDYDIPRSLENSGPVMVKYRPRQQYCNVTIPLREEERDSIPEEMAPPPPV